MYKLLVLLFFSTYSFAAVTDVENFVKHHVAVTKSRELVPVYAPSVKGIEYLVNIDGNCVLRCQKIIHNNLREYCIWRCNNKNNSRIDSALLYKLLKSFYKSKKFADRYNRYKSIAKKYIYLKSLFE